jgi:hypothetical protein
MELFTEMYIREKKSSPKGSQAVYRNYFIVETKRIGLQQKQVTVLNLGSKFNLDRNLWTPLTNRIEKILYNQPELFPDPRIEYLAQELAAKIKPKMEIKDISQGSPERVAATNQKPKFQFNSMDDIEKSNLRTFGIGFIALHAMKQLHYDKIFESLEQIPEVNKKIAMALIAAKMEKPTSEEATFKMLAERSGIGDLLGIDFSSRSVMCLHRTADFLIQCKDQIETMLSIDRTNLFNSTSTVLLYDLTNTYFHGNKYASPKLKRGLSKQKRSDCLLESMAVFLDGDDYVRKTLFYPGNVSEPKTLLEILDAFNPAPGTTLVMDRGIATEDNVNILTERGYKYFVGSRRTKRIFDNDQTCSELKSSSGKTIKMYHTHQDLKTTDGSVVKELWLHCHSDDRKAKEVGINTRKVEGYKKGLIEIQTMIKNAKKPILLSKVMEKIGVLNNKYHVKRHFKYTLDRSPIEKGMIEPYVKGLTYKYEPIQNTKVSDPGAYIIRTNQFDLPDSEIWTRYTKLTDIESAFGTLKSGLGFRPNYHKKEFRIDCHLFIAVLAYQCVNYIRRVLRSHGIHDSWRLICNDLSNHGTSTVSVNTTNRGKLSTSGPYKPTDIHYRIYNALGISSEVDKLVNPK